MPDISIKDDLDLSVDFEPGDTSALAKYFKSSLQFLNPDGKIRKFAPLSLADDALSGLHADLNLAQPIAALADGISLSLKAGLGAEIDVFVPDLHLEAGETDSLFAPDNYGEDVPVEKNERFVSVAFIGNIGPAVSTKVSDFKFGFAANSSLAITNYQKFSLEPQAPKLLDAIGKTFTNFLIPTTVADLSAMLPDSVITMSGSGSLAFSATANLLAVANPLATAELPAPIGSIELTEGASVRVGASFRLFGDYEIRVRKTGASTVRLGYFKERGKEWKATVDASAGVSLSVGGGDDLFAQVLSAFSPDPEAEFQELNKAGVDKLTIASIQATIQAALERTLEIATSFEIASMDASQAAFLYEIDLASVDQNGGPAIQAALRGDLSAFVGNEGAPPRGIKMVQSVFTNLQQRKRTFKVNLLGIYSFTSISKLTLKGKALYDPESGDLILSDSATATSMQAGVSNLGSKANAADPTKLRKALASSLLITAAYRASQTIVTAPSLKSSHLYCELHDQTDRQTMGEELGVAVGLKLMTRAEQDQLLGSDTQFGRTIVYASADYNDALAASLFLQNDTPRVQTEYEDIGRVAMQAVVTRGGQADPIRLKPLQNDPLWKQMKDGGQSKFRALLPDATQLQLGVITADYSTIMWWAQTMCETAQALAKVRYFLIRDPNTDPNNEAFQKLRSDLAQRLKAVAADTKEEFGRPWGLIAMDLLTGNRSEASVTFTGPVISISRARPLAAGAGRPLI